MPFFGVKVTQFAAKSGEIGQTKTVLAAKAANNFNFIFMKLTDQFKMCKTTYALP
jgi:hypothetical protein